MSIPLIERDDSGKLHVNEEGCQFLNSLQHPLAVIGISGANRMGKSYLANIAFLNKPAFSVGSTVKPCTKGILVAHEVVRTESGLAYIVLDSEGVSALDTSDHEDVEIMSLMYLLTSLFVYNSVGRVDKTNLNMLSLVSKTVKLITQNNEDLHTDDRPCFLWILRDFALQLAGEYDATEYIANIVEPSTSKKRKLDGADEETKERLLIRSGFSSYQGQFFSCPSSDANVLQNLQSCNPSKISSTFLQEVHQFKTQRFPSLLRTKKVCGKPVTGPLLVPLIRKYVEILNSGKIPTIRNHYGLLCETSISVAALKVMQKFKSSCRKINAFAKKQHILFTQLGVLLQLLVAESEREFRAQCYEPDHPLTTQKWKELRLHMKGKVETMSGQNKKATLGWIETLQESFVTAGGISADLLSFYQSSRL